MKTRLTVAVAPCAALAAAATSVTEAGRTRAWGRLAPACRPQRAGSALRAGQSVSGRASPYY
jgi:hypothetical protein